MAWKITTAATEFPVTLAEAKVHLKVLSSDEDLLITRNIQTATQHIEKLINQILVTSTVTEYFDFFPGELVPIELCLYPISAINSVKYIQTDGNEGTWTDDNYVKDLVSRRARIAPKSGKVYPTAQDEIQSVRVEYVVGYGAASAVPSKFKDAILQLVGELYQNRENRVKQLPTTVLDILYTELDFTIE